MELGAPKFTRTRDRVELKFIDDKDVEEMSECLSKVLKSKKELGCVSLRDKSRRSAALKHKEDEDGDHEVQDLLNLELPEEYMEPATNKLSALLLNENAEIDFGFQTPKKRCGMSLKAQESANKYYSTPTKNETPSKSRSKKAVDLLTPVKTPSQKNQSVARSSKPRISFGGVMESTPSKGNVCTPLKSLLKIGRETPRTPTSSKRNGDGTSSRLFKRIMSNENTRFGTPSRRQSMAAIKENTSAIPRTPHRERLRHKESVQKAIERALANDGSESESSLEDDMSGDDEDDDYKPENEESSEDEESLSDDNENSGSDDEKAKSPVRKTALTLVTKKDPIAATPSRSRRREVNYEFKTDAYFETMASRDITSNNTLSHLRNPRLREDTIRDLLKDTDVDHKEPLRKLTEEHHTLFARWLFTLSEGFNILLYGLGSKRHLLQVLHNDVLGDSQVLVINGFFPGLTIKEILDTILTGLLGVVAPPAKPLEAVAIITNIQSSRNADTLYLLIHNLDGPSLRNNKAQTVLSKLAKIPNVRLIASVDHINAALMWDQTKLYRYNFSWWDVTTFLPYSAETSFETSLLIQRSGALQLSALHNVFKSLNDNSKKIYLMIAKHQLENANNDSYIGFPLENLYWMAREAFVVSAQPVLRQILREFQDHNMIKMKRGGAELLVIPIENTLVQQFVQAQEEKAD